MKLSAKTGVALTITALSLVVTVGAGASDSAKQDQFRYVRQLPAYPAHVDLMNQLRNLTEQNAIKWGWSQGGGVDESQSSGQPSVEVSGDTALKVDRAVAAANEAYDTYRDKTATAARAALAQPSAANARVPADTSSAFAAQESLRIGRYLPRVVVQIRSNGQLAGTQSRAGSTRYGYVVAGGLITP